MRLVVTADDYGIAPATSAAIRELMSQGRLSGTSCMTVFEDWQGEALRPFVSSHDLGVHLTLTDQPALSGGVHPGFGTRLRDAWTGRIDLAAVEAELTAQVARFTAVLGAPRFLDGHQHVHQLPGVRDIVVRLASDHGATVRTTVERVGTVVSRGVDVPRALAFAAAGRGLRQRSVRAGVPVNEGFTGVYDLSDAVPFDDLARRFLTGVRPGTWWMVHPGAADALLRARDPVVDRRAREAAWLASDAFSDLLGQADLSIGRVPSS